ncbi:hypothetical protein VXQ92_01380 [Acinetobacter sp. 228]|uniref:hypothetical protein n=1 Tax=Acinetobacter sp. 228 TaxID=3114700 RepID=UPI003A8A04D6
MWGGQLHNPDHDHIVELLLDNEEFLGFTWTSSAAVAKKMYGAATLQQVAAYQVEQRVQLNAPFADG